MATLPRAVVRVEPTSGAPAGGTDLICVLSPCVSSDDMVPRLFGSAQAVAAQHGYCPGVEYAALHAAETGLSFLFVGMPIGTAGAISRFTSHGNTGSSVVSIAAGSDGVLDEHDGVLRVLAGGTIGTSQIRLELSLDGGRSFKPVRLGTAASYVLPNVNATVSFAAGTLVAGDTIAEWHGSAPRITPADLTTVREALADQLKSFRTILLCSDLPDSTAADACVSVMNAYATSNDRFCIMRASAYDRLPQARMSRVTWRMTGSPTLTFAEVGGTGDTVTRNTGSWIADGAVVGDTVTFALTASNNISGVIASLSATVITFDTEALVAEVVAGATATGSPTITFAEVGATLDTITRNRGSWLSDGFRVADSIAPDGTASNDFTAGIISAVTATVITLTTQALVAESIRADAFSLVSNQTKAAWMAELDAEFADVDDEERLDISAGRGAKFSPFSGWFARRPCAWAASVREYQHDIHVASWRKDLGTLGYDLFDSAETLVEWDDRVDGGAGSAARFTTFRTWANGPRGSFIAQSLTRKGDGQITSQTHNAIVVNHACNTVQTATENVIGRSLQLNSDGTATLDSLAVIAAEVNAALDLALLQSNGEGPRASKAVWTPNPADLYNVPEPIMHGTLELVLNGTIHSVATAVRIRTNGQ